MANWISKSTDEHSLIKVLHWL